MSHNNGNPILSEVRKKYTEEQKARALETRRKNEEALKDIPEEVLNKQQIIRFILLKKGDFIRDKLYGLSKVLDMHMVDNWDRAKVELEPIREMGKTQLSLHMNGATRFRVVYHRLHL